VVAIVPLEDQWALEGRLECQMIAFVVTWTVHERVHAGLVAALE
jgi:hypothetical protein